MICIYHSKDLDGYCSGAIVKKKYPDAKMIGYDYGQDLPMDKIPLNEPIIMIDVSLPMSAMLDLARYSGWKLTWIDHHASAIKDFNEFTSGGESPFTAVLQDGIAACEVGWKYLFPDEEMPTAVKLLGEYDTWRNSDKEKWDNTILPFQYGMRMICSSPETFPEELFSNENEIGIFIADVHCAKIADNGQLILKYQKQQNERSAKFLAFECEFEGLRAICINSGGANSQLFDSVYDEEKHDIMIPFAYTGKHWTFSLYTTKDAVDCSQLAKSKGGGGHKKAAGFKLDYLPENFKKNA
jgi:oligoribonuclease NrnB/cAMP/cGMP phosphodiesterase (DHH superfamily)